MFFVVLSYTDTFKEKSSSLELLEENFSKLAAIAVLLAGKVHMKKIELIVLPITSALEDTQSPTSENESLCELRTKQISLLPRVYPADHT